MLLLVRVLLEAIVLLAALLVDPVGSPLFPWSVRDTRCVNSGLPWIRRRKGGRRGASQGLEGT